MRNQESVQGSRLRKNEEVHPREATGRDRLSGEGGLSGELSEGDERGGRAWARLGGLGEGTLW